jgi:hypothetical protein
MMWEGHRAQCRNVPVMYHNIGTLASLQDKVAFLTGFWILQTLQC